MALLAGRLGLTRDPLPLLWDADFMLGGVVDLAEERHVLCEINVSSVAPCPESANAALVAAVGRNSC